MSQFQFVNHDIVDFKVDQFEESTYIMLLIAIEAEHPGLLAAVVRLAALADYGWTLTSRSSKPQESLEAQRGAIEWMRRFEEALAYNESKRRKE